MGRGDEDAVEPTPAWVIEQLLDVGFSPGDAVLLAEARVDYRKVAAAIGGGCTHEQAVRIFV